MGGRARGGDCCKVQSKSRAVQQLSSKTSVAPASASCYDEPPSPFSDSDFPSLVADPFLFSFPPLSSPLLAAIFSFVFAQVAKVFTTWYVSPSFFGFSPPPLCQYQDVMKGEFNLLFSREQLVGLCQYGSGLRVSVFINLVN